MAEQRENDARNRLYSIIRAFLFPAVAAIVTAGFNVYMNATGFRSLPAVYITAEVMVRGLLAMLMLTLLYLMGRNVHNRAGAETERTQISDHSRRMTLRDSGTLSFLVFCVVSHCLIVGSCSGSAPNHIAVFSSWPLSAKKQPSQGVCHATRFAALADAANTNANAHQHAQHHQHVAECTAQTANSCASR